MRDSLTFFILRSLALLLVSFAVSQSYEADALVAIAQYEDHFHKEEHREFNDHDSDVASTEASHSHEHRHTPDQPPHSHQHRHDTKSSGPDSKIVFAFKAHQFVPSAAPAFFARDEFTTRMPGYLLGIFRPPIA